MSCNADYVQFRPAIEFDQSTPSTPADSRGWVSHINTTIDANIQVEWDVERFSEYANWSGHNYGKCYWSSLQTVITPDGRVWVCCNKRGTDGACIGDLTKEPFRAIWKRHKVAEVNDKCRIMCRGHMPNKIIHSILKPMVHGNFI